MFVLHNWENVKFIYLKIILIILTSISILQREDIEYILTDLLYMYKKIYKILLKYIVKVEMRFCGFVFSYIYVSSYNSKEKLKKERAYNIRE